jgi:transcriptional regulator with XRE-family HTH domain
MRKYFYTQDGGMISLRTVLAQNMKAQRQNLGISQAQLVERVKTSASYIDQIETEMRLPKPEMLERIAVVLEIEPPSLFTTEIRFLAEAETLAQVQKQIIDDIPKVVSQRINIDRERTTIIMKYSLTWMNGYGNIIKNVLTAENTVTGKRLCRHSEILFH